MARLTRTDMEAALAFGAEVGTAASQSDRVRTAALAQTGRLLAASDASERIAIPHQAPN
jgi:hypothetical protein